MTTQIEIVLKPGKAGLISFPGITAESTRTASELLQKNHVNHHGFFSHLGFHNHIAEDLLTCYDFGATPANLHNIYNRVKKVQRPRPEADAATLVDLADEGAWHKYLGENSHYADFLAFFEGELAQIGWQGMLDRRLFARTDAADDILARCFSGIFHPLIRMGSGMEFGLPGLVAEGLSLAASSGSWPTEFFVGAEKAAAVAKDCEEKSLRTLFTEIHNNKKIRGTQGPTYKGLLAIAKDEIISYAAQYRVRTDQIEVKNAESISVVALLLGGAMRKDKEVKVDFFLLHCVTVSIFLTTFMAQDWITLENKARLLEWKVRFDMLTYATVGAPELHIDEIKNYVPKVAQDGAGNPWLPIIERGVRLEDDGHTIKVVRALVSGERICAGLEGMDLPVVDDMWCKVAAMSVDSAEGLADCLGGEYAWVRGAGFDTAWEIFGPRKA